MQVLKGKKRSRGQLGDFGTGLGASRQSLRWNPGGEAWSESLVEGGKSVRGTRDLHRGFFVPGRKKNRKADERHTGST